VIIQSARRPTGGDVDRTHPIRFTFNGKECQGYHGDTLASALLANGVQLIGRSFKYHRPRGFVGSGFDDANGLVQLESGGITEPNLQATRIELYDGLSARSQNCWPSVNFDVGTVNTLISRLIPSGFYYKTFMWPRKLWMAYEHVIRRAAGMGECPTEIDPDDYEHRFQHCDVLIAGGGPAGLAAALAAGRAGARVILANAEPAFGGTLLSQRVTINGQSGTAWIGETLAELRAMTEVTLLSRTVATAYYDHNLLILNEQITDHRPHNSSHLPRQRLWKVRAREVVLATGALERPIVFANNDRPGVMLTSAAQTFANRYGVRAGRQAVVFTNNDSAYPAAFDLADAGIQIQAIVDIRITPPGHLVHRARQRNIGVLAGQVVSTVSGRSSVRAVTVSPGDAPEAQQKTGQHREIQCDLLCMSGGWTPSVHLLSQSRGTLRYDDTLTAFVPHQSFQNERSTGACNGTFALTDCLQNGYAAGADAACQAGFETDPCASFTSGQSEAFSIQAIWSVAPLHGNHGKCFVDFQNDVTADDVALAHRENYLSVEHLKRYTTLGMGTDQGRTSNVNGLAIMAGLRNEDIAAVGTTTFRPPFSPISLGAIAGSEIGRHFIPIRRSALHEAHAAAGATFVRAGQWLRPQYYQTAGESMWQSIWREARQVREKVGIVDVSTLGKIDVQGKDAADLLDRLYINGFRKLDVGRCRYGIMLREDGMVFDDGTVTRLAEHHYLVTTTTINAAAVLQHMEFMADIEWPELNVHITSVTDAWAAIALAGPQSRNLLRNVIDDIDLSNGSCPFMAYREGTVCGIPVRLFRISFSGELAYEINIPADFAPYVWNRLLTHGEAYGVTPYGTEAMGILRMEKGHLVGGEINGRTTAGDLGVSRMCRLTKEYIGKRAAERPGLQAPDRARLVGLVPVDGKSRIPRGARIVTDPDQATPAPLLGEVTSACFSPNLGHPIGLALVRNGHQRIDETVWASSPLSNENVLVRITEPVFIDPGGERLRA